MYVGAPSYEESWIRPWVRILLEYRLVGGSLRVTLVVVFDFLPQKFGRWQGPRNGDFAQKRMQPQCMLGGKGHYNTTKLV